MSSTRTKQPDTRRGGVGSNASTRPSRRPPAPRVDVHCHCLPELDDGPKELEHAIKLCQALITDGVTDVVATPHQLGRYAGAVTGPRIRKAAATLEHALDERGLALRIWHGAEVRLDEQLVDLVLRGEALTVARTHWLLLELPDGPLIDPRPMIAQLGNVGIRVIISHPERYSHVLRQPDLVPMWAQAGAVMQITASSLLGAAGRAVEELAWAMVEHGQAAHLIASDAHDLRHRPPQLTPAWEAIRWRLGPVVANRLCIENPARVLADQATLFDARSVRTRGGTDGKGEAAPFYNQCAGGLDARSRRKRQARSRTTRRLTWTFAPFAKAVRGGGVA